MAGYLQRLRAGLDAAGLGCPLLMMMSGGGLTTLELAARFPVRLVESGPAGGAILAATLGREIGAHHVMAFDMGGTTAKVCLISGGEPERARRFEIGRIYRNLKGSGLPVRIPVIELVEIGAGGGSIGRVDALSRITVGPDSAGAEPGPACYGRGGQAATVTDANLVLGRIDATRFAGGRLALDDAAARAALERDIGVPLQLDAPWAAAGLCEIVEENMANAARVHAVERGKALPEFTMVAFGGGAPLHAVRVAAKLGITRVLVPRGAGVGSAIGFLRAPMAFEVVRSSHGRLRGADPHALNARLAAMQAEAWAVVAPAARGAGVNEAALRVERLAELRYEGQGHELQVSVPSGLLEPRALAQMGADFEAAYLRNYGLNIPGAEVEVVTWSVTVSTPPAAVASAALPAAQSRSIDPQTLAHAPEAPRAPQASEPSRGAAPIGTRPVWDPTAGRTLEFAQHWRFDLGPSARLQGPALIVEHETTTVLPPGWAAQVDSLGHLHLQRGLPQDKRPATA